VLDLIDAVERLRKAVVPPKEAVVERKIAMDKVERAVGKVAEGIDVYLILAVSQPWVVVATSCARLGMGPLVCSR